METVDLLQKHERAGEHKVINKGDETFDFWKIWNLDTTPENPYIQSPEWDHWFMDVNIYIYILNIINIYNI